MNTVVLVGRLTKNPEIRFIPGSGTPVATFTIAIDRNYTKKDGTKETDFIPVEVVGKSAEFCQNYITKGRLVAVSGSLRVDRYQTKEGENKTFTKVSASSINALDKKGNNAEQPMHEPPAVSGIESSGFQAFDDDEIPF